MSDFTGAGGAAYMSNRMDWETPTDLFSKLDDEFHFTLDAASSATNHKCQKYYTAEDSGRILVVVATPGVFGVVVLVF